MLLWTAAAVAVLLAGVTLVLRYPPVQTYLAQRAAAYLARELQTTVTLDGVRFRPFSSIVLQGLYIADREGDTLLYAHQLSASVDLPELRDNRVTVRAVKLAGGRFYLRADDTGTNLAFVLDYFRSPNSGPPGRGKRLSLDVRTIDLADASFGFRRTRSPERSRTATPRIDFNDLYVTEIGGRISDIRLRGNGLQASIHGLRFREKSGFTLRRLNAAATIDTARMVFDELLLETNRSRLGDYAELRYTDFTAFRNVMKAVTFNMRLRETRLASADIAFFAPALAPMHVELGLSGIVTGTVSDFAARQLTVRLGQGTVLAGEASVIGLPDIGKTLFDLRLDRLTTTKTEIETLVPAFYPATRPELPAMLDRLGQVTYRGTVRGLYHDFQLDGELETAAGTLHSTAQLNLRDGGQYEGRFAAEGFDLNLLLQQPAFGNSSFGLAINGGGFTPAQFLAHIRGQIAYLDIDGYRYRDIEAETTITGQAIEGQVTIDDANLTATATGRFGWSTAQPVYALTAQLGHTRLDRIGLYLRAPLTVEQAVLTADGAGTQLNTMTGAFTVRDLRFSVDSVRHTVDSVHLSLTGTPDDRLLQLQSDLADANVRGRLHLTALPAYFRSAAMQYFSSLTFADATPATPAFEVGIQVKRYAPIASLFTPKLTLSEDTRLDGRFGDPRQRADIRLRVPQLTYGALQVAGLSVDEAVNGDSLRLVILTDRLALTDSLYIENARLTASLADGQAYINLLLADRSGANRLNFNGRVDVRTDEPITLQVLPSALTLNRNAWRLSERARFRFQANRIDVNGFEIANASQHVRLEGTASTAPEDQLTLTFHQFDLATVNPLTQSAGMDLGGTLNGHLEVSAALRNPYAVADLRAGDVRLNRSVVGDMRLQADFDRVSQLVNVTLEAVRAGETTIAARGTYNAAAETDKLDVQAQFQRSNLALFQPFLRELVSDLSGMVSADLRFSGSVFDPQVDGTCYLHDAGFTVNYLGTPYRITDQVTVENSTLLLNGLTITDSRNHRAVANGTVNLRNLRVPVIDVVIDATDFHILNTTRRYNPLYYGTAYGTGQFSFHGPTNAISIDIRARTDDQTRFYIPLNAVGTVSENDFIRFVSADTASVAPRPRSPLLRGLSMNMDLQITPDAETSLYTDLGELSGRGEGILTLRISSLGDFEMFGDYTINSGKFTFTAQDFINKIFDINPGGTIRWTGQPTEATVNLAATYALRTSLAPLYNAAGRETVEQRVLAQAQMNLSGNLMRPEITFDLNFPNEPYVRDELQSYLSDANNVNQQALSLILRRSFTPGAAADLSRELNNTLLSAGTELAFNQLNNLISQSLNLRFVDLNIRSLNEASASFRFFNDRLIFTGGVTDRRNLNDLNVFSDRVVTDAELLYLIRKDGRLVLRGSNRLNSRNSLPLTINENYVSAVGLLYRQEFYTFDEFLRRLFTIRPKDEGED